MMMMSVLRKAVIVLCCILVMQCRSDTVTDGESESAARVILYKVSSNEKIQWCILLEVKQCDLCLTICKYINIHILIYFMSFNEKDSGCSICCILSMNVVFVVIPVSGIWINYYYYYFACYKNKLYCSH